MKNDGVIFGLTGPSGVGKGFIKDCLKKSYPQLVELSVITTRRRRVSDGADRVTDVPVGLFLEGTRGSDIVFAHQPFGTESDWYGFCRQQIESYLSQGKQILTEIHVDNVKLFKETYGDKVTLIAMKADENLLRENLMVRNSETDSEVNCRLQAAIHEIEAIQKLETLGMFDAVVELTRKTKPFAERTLLAYLERFFTEPETQQTRGKESH